MERGEARLLVQQLCVSCYEVGSMSAQHMQDTDAFKAERDTRDSLWDDVLDAIYDQEPATQPAEFELALQGARALVAGIEGQIDKQTHARDVVNLALDGLNGFRAVIAAVVAEMEELIELQ